MNLNNFFKGSQMVLTIMARTSKIGPRSSRCPLGECHQAFAQRSGWRISPSASLVKNGRRNSPRPSLSGERWKANFTKPLSGEKWERFSPSSSLAKNGGEIHQWDFAIDYFEMPFSLTWGYVWWFSWTDSTTTSTTTTTEDERQYDNKTMGPLAH